MAPSQVPWLSGAALWSSGFRPFFLVGTAYGVLGVAAWALMRNGLAPPAPIALPLLHAHELVFGFAAAVIVGVLLTAIPSWSGTEELGGRPLMLLVAVWALGRGAVWLDRGPAGLLAAAIDCLLLPLVAMLLAATMRGPRRRLFYWSLPPLIGLAAANAAFHVGAARDSAEDVGWALRLAVHAIGFLFSLYGGLLTPAFTRNFLRSRGEPAAGISPPLEYATAAAMVAYAGADLAGVDGAVFGAIVAVALVLHAIRLARWRGWRTTSEPLLWTLHAAYLWFMASMVLRGASALVRGIAPDAWIHAFTLGALGLMMVSLMTRVALRHTGRPMVVAAPMRAAFWLVMAAALTRLCVSLGFAGNWAVLASALFWIAAFATYLVLHGPMLAGASLPRNGPRAPPPER